MGVISVCVILQYLVSTKLKHNEENKCHVKNISTTLKPAFYWHYIKGSVFIICNTKGDLCLNYPHLLQLILVINRPTNYQSIDQYISIFKTINQSIIQPFDRRPTDQITFKHSTNYQSIIRATNNQSINWPTNSNRSFKLLFNQSIIRPTDRPTDQRTK